MENRLAGAALVTGQPWELIHYAQLVTGQHPWHITGGPGLVKDPMFVTICGERGSTVKVAHGELPRYAKLCVRCSVLAAGGGEGTDK